MTTLSKDHLRVTAQDWNTFLDENDVPPNRYMDCFRDFTRRERQGRFTVYDLRDAWWRIRSKFALGKKTTTSNDRLCGGCYGTGWASKELVEVEGGKRVWRKLEVKESSKTAVFAQNGYVKPCSCPKGRQFDRSHKEAVEENEKTMRSFQNDNDDK